MPYNPKTAVGLSEPDRKAELTILFSNFEIPPVQDVLLIGRFAPIGPEAVQRMVDYLSPDQYELVRLEHPVFEAAVLKKNLLKLMPEEKLIPLILEEGERIGTEDGVIKAQVKITVRVNRAVEL